MCTLCLSTPPLRMFWKQLNVTLEATSLSPQAPVETTSLRLSRDFLTQNGGAINTQQQVLGKHWSVGRKHLGIQRFPQKSLRAAMLGCEHRPGPSAVLLHTGSPSDPRSAKRAGQTDHSLQVSVLGRHLQASIAFPLPNTQC